MWFGTGTATVKAYTGKPGAPVTVKAEATSRLGIVEGRVAILLYVKSIKSQEDHVELE